MSVFILIHIHYLFGVSCTKSPEKHVEAKSGVRWSDTLSNRASFIASLAPMDNDIERFMRKWEIKGISFAVTRHDSLLYAKGYGMADVSAGKTMDASTIMRMASVSKLVTAVGIMKLCENGKLSLDSKVFGEDGILNDTVYTNAMRDPRMRDITVDHLLRHKGGFTLGAGDPMFNTKDIMAVKRLTTPPTNEELTKIVLGRRLGFTPGAGRRYSNFGYMLLSLVIERVTDMNYWDYIREAVLEPAGAYQFRPATNYYADRHDKETRYYPPDNELVEEFNGSGNMVERVYGGSNVNGLMGSLLQKVDSFGSIKMLALIRTKLMISAACKFRADIESERIERSVMEFFSSAADIFKSYAAYSADSAAEIFIYDRFRNTYGFEKF